VKTPLALKQIPDRARQRGITPEEVVKNVMLGKSQIKEMMSPVEVANLFVIGSPSWKNILSEEIFFLMEAWSRPIEKALFKVKFQLTSLGFHCT
jgi:hypothetical protein